MIKRSMSLSAKLSSLVAFCVIGSLQIAPAFAGSDSDSLDVSASVSAVCTISAAPMSFGAYDPIVANASSALTAQSDITVQCTDGAAASIVLGLGQNSDAGTDDDPKRRMSDGGTELLSYGLFSDAGHSVIWGNSSNSDVEHTGTGAAAQLSVFGSIPGGQNVKAGSYSDTVLATINF